MKSRRIFITRNVLETGQIECRMATVKPNGEAIITGNRGSSCLAPGEFGLTWDEAKALAEYAREARCAELQGELNHLRMTTFQRVGG